MNQDQKVIWYTYNSFSINELCDVPIYTSSN